MRPTMPLLAISLKLRINVIAVIDGYQMPAYIRSVNTIIRRLVILLLLFASVGVVSFAAETEGEDSFIMVEGFLVPGGVECQFFQGDDEKQYTLVGDLTGFKDGDHVKITGKREEISFCMQGITLSVKKIEKTASPL